MNRIILVLLPILLLSACSKEFEEQNSVESMVFYTTMENCSDTKVHLDESLKARWDANDSVSVFVGSTYNQLYKFNGSSGDSEDKLVPVGNSGSGSSLSANYAVYPYNPSTSITADGVLSVVFPSTQHYAKGSYGIGANTMVAVSSSIDDNNLVFKNVCGYLRVSLFGDATITRVTLQGNNGEKLSGNGTITVSSNDTTTVSMSSSRTTSITIDCGDGVSLGADSASATDFYFVVPPMTLSKGITIIVTALDGGVFEKRTLKSIEITRNRIQKMAAVEYGTSSLATPQMVNLGLSVKWGSFNLGASSPEEFGDYYAWGETETHYKAGYAHENPQAHWKEDKSLGYAWSTYKWCNGKYNALSKYNNSSDYGTVDSKGSLSTDDDAARVALGGNWRLPTYTEWGELMNSSNCTWTWTTLNGVNGYKVQSKKSGYTKNWIFIPAAGCWDGDSYGFGAIGKYWSLSRHGTRPYNAYYARLRSTDVYRGDANRYQGFSIRPVSQ